LDRILGAQGKAELRAVHTLGYIVRGGETRLGLVGRNCVIRVAQYLTTWVQFRCGDCSPLVGFQVQLRKTREL
jgi:hypothetical protein